MFAKHLISSSESLYMQMIHANYINNNIPGSKRSALVHRPGFAELQTNSQRAAFCPAHRQTPREREETGPGREDEMQKEPELPLCSLLAQRGAGSGAATSPTSISACTQHPAGPRRPPCRHPGPARCSRQGWLVWKSLLSLCNAAAHQHLSKSPAPLLASSSLSIYPPIVSANNGALRIYSIFHPGVSPSVPQNINEGSRHPGNVSPTSAPPAHLLGCPPKVLMTPWKGVRGG